MSEVPHSHEIRFDQLDESALLQPVPTMDELRERKQGYSQLPIDALHPLFNESVVNVNEYEIAGQAYYSRSNLATKKAVDGVKAAPYLRNSVAETLVIINALLAQPAITKFFGGDIELWVEDALRPASLQDRLYNQVFPDLIREQNPGISHEAMQERRKHLIAVPSLDPLRPSPHATGGVLDLALRFKQTTTAFVKGSQIEFGHMDGDTSERANPDYYEQHNPQNENENERTARRHRRAFYAIMTGKVFGVDSGLVNNPTEWWHWGRGDQLSAKVHGDSSAYYSLAPNQDTA